MAWRVYRVELIAAWMLSAPEDKRRLMHYWFAAMIKHRCLVRGDLG